MKKLKVLTKTEIQAKIKKESDLALGISVGIGAITSGMGVMLLILVISAGISPGVNHPAPETAFEDALTQYGTAMLNCLFIGVVGIFAGKFFNELGRNYTPFSQKNIKCLKAISGVMSGMSSVALLSGIALTIFLDSSPLFYEHAILYGLVGILFAAIARIFDYGVLLQQESDETL
jgi:hypothetical protein